MRPMRRHRRGVAVTEYLLLLSVLVIALVAAAWVVVPVFGEGVAAVGADVGDLLVGKGNAAVPARATTATGTCPYTFDPRTGRWHDAENDYLMVSFAEAAAQGC